MAERTPQSLNVMLQSVRECRLTKNQVLRLWKCAVKDDDKLVDAVIEKLYEEMIAFEIDTMLQYDRLGIPKKLEHIGNELKSNRISDPERLVPILGKIQADQRLVNYARAIAGKMKEDILAKKR